MARDEIETVVRRSKLAAESDVQILPHLHAVVKETLQLHPPAPVALRECHQQCNVGGYELPEKMSVAINLYSIMRDSNLWHDPDMFMPEIFGSQRRR